MVEATSSPLSPFRQTMTGAAVVELRRRILSGAVAAGEALRQDALAREFGISRIPIREAFRQLAAEGLVTLHPHRGAVVTALSATDIAELFDLRATLEPDLMRRAVPRLRDRDLAHAEQILSDYSEAIRVGDLDAWGELNTEFHLSLYRAADRSQTFAIVKVLLANTDRYTRVQLAMADGATARAKQEHAELLAFCRAGDAQRAAELTLRHVEAVRRDLLSLLQPAEPVADETPRPPA
ncbi:GntR family transcriptional regulator [Bosea sp. UNC402CLCol]|uniref:GntR family transcriptional regulator n=1 Tax=Bosea sp. UNC402CLCol TaxID=1510531 RepID=UPI00056E5835|nr:GntR family transcriptional regulator [Bosea sp. UNC402CLCol]